MKRLNKSEKYPYNLIREVLEYDDYNEDINDDMINGLNFIINNLNDQERETIRLRYEERLTYDEIAKKLSVSKWCATDRIKRVLRKLRTPKHIKFVRYGLEFLTVSEKQESQRLERILKAEQNNIRDILIEDLNGITVRTYIVLNNKGLDTIGKLIDFKDNNGSEWYRHIPNFTVQSLKEVISIFKYVEMNVGVEE